MSLDSTDEAKDTDSVAIIFARFGPYHLARLKAAGLLFGEKGLRVVGVEVAGTDKEYQWAVQEGAEGFTRVTIFPNRNYNDLTPNEIGEGVGNCLDRIGPAAVAAPGWGFPEARAALRWCKANNRASIFMSESKKDDMPRPWWKEWIKKRLVRQFNAALVGGTPHLEYTIQLGIPKERVFMGYDVVDNAYFEFWAGQARQEARKWRLRLGLPEQYYLTCCRFIEKKNLFRVIEAYARYKAQNERGWGLVICGGGELKSELHEHAHRLGVEKIVWPGFIQYDLLPVYYGLASAFILGSTSEQWGLVVNEAMASGLPVLVSKTAGCSYDLVRDAENGFLFDPFSVDEIYGAMVRIGQMRDFEREEMGRKSHQVIQAWGPERFAQGLWKAVQVARGELHT